MDFNAKTNISYVNKVRYYVSNYNVNNGNVTRVNYIKDLRIYFDSNLKFKTTHITKIASEDRKSYHN